MAPAQLSVVTSKSFDKDRLSAGDDAVATIKSTNEGSPVHILKISDTQGDGTPFFDEHTTFNGFTQPVQYPQGAVKGEVVYHMLADSSTVTIPFDSNTVPAKPDLSISGFDVVFTADGDGIGTGIGTSLAFDVLSSAASLPDGSAETTLKNTATSTVTTQNGRSSKPSSDDAELTLVKPGITAKLNKTISPANNVEPGHTAVVSLNATATATTDYVKTDNITVEDSWGSDKASDGFWNAFDISAIQPTQVPADASLTVEMQQTDGTWVQIDARAAQSDTSMYRLSANDLTDVLAAKSLNAGDIIGVRFVFQSTPGTTMSTTASVKPYIAFTARSTLRKDGGPVDVTDGGSQSAQKQTAYSNGAKTETSAKVKDDTLTDSATAKTGTGIIVYPGDTGTGPAAKVSKHWVQDSVPAQTGAAATTHLNWRVNKGLGTVTLTDPASNADTPKSTSFDAFNLTKISALNVSDQPYANGWFLKYDTVASIELYYSGGWHTVAAPDGSWQDAKGNFKGYTLSASEQGNLLDGSGATGARITVVANDAARTVAAAQGNDPHAPDAGSGVAASSADRTFDLQWQLRSKTRSDGAFITGSSRLNVPASSTDDDMNLGVVSNTVLVEGTYGDKIASDQGSDTISIDDQPPSVASRKTVNPSAIVVPVKSSVKDADYPRLTYTLSAWNNAASPASYVRLTDPTICPDTALNDCATDNTAAGAKANPFTKMDASAFDSDPAAPNPFNRLNLTNISISAPSPQVDLSKSVVWLLRYTSTGSGSGTYRAESSTADTVNAMTQAQLADVVGISVTFQGSDPENTGGTIQQGVQQGSGAVTNSLNVQMSAQVRSTLRSSGESYEPSALKTDTSTNRLYTQSYDPITAGKSEHATNTSSARLDFQGATLDVSPTKSITPVDGSASDSDISEADSGALRKVTLQATPGKSTVSPAKVTLSDEPDGQGASTGFWKNFALKSFDAVTFPEGASQVEISVYGPFGDDGSMAWKSGGQQDKASDGSSYVLPVSADRYQDIQGVRLVFSNADGSIFSQQSANWQQAGAAFTVALRDSVQHTTPFWGQATNMLTALSESGAINSTEKSTDATVKWGQGTAVLEINKLANEGDRQASVGAMVPWDITIKNGGTGYLDLVDVVDTLPDGLLYTGQGSPANLAQAVQFTAGKMPDGSAGSLSTAPTVDSSESGKVVFSWADGKSRLRPQEKAVIRIWLELQPGPKSGEKVTNVVYVNTKQLLSGGVLNAVPGDRDGTVIRNSDYSGRASDYISPTAGENLLVNKGISGALSGAVNTFDQTQACTPSLKGIDGKNYYRSPCMANSKVNGTDSWLLRMTNAGTTDVSTAQFFDQLPVSGDKNLVASDTQRGSTFRPQLLDSLNILGAPEGTTSTIEVTNDTDACVGTWTTVPAAAKACGANVWSVAGSGTDWSKVTGIRITLDFTTSVGGALAPGQTVDVDYSTKNVPATSSDTTGASTDVSAVNQFAWNQAGLLYTGPGVAKTLGTAKVGVHLRTGSLQVVKKVGGDAAQYAPESFDAHVTCTIAQGDTGQNVPLTFSGQSGLDVKLVRLEDGSYQAQRVTGIPVGAVCRVAENGETGSYGETTRQNAVADLSILGVDGYASATQETGEPGNEVPESQVATITNGYEYSGLSVTKKVDTLADKGKFGPFEFRLSCKTSNGQTVHFAEGDELSFSLAAGETWKAPANTIPANSLCSVEETDADGASSTAFTGDGVSQTGGDTATIKVGTGSAQLVSSLVSNYYDGGTITVRKQVAGAGAAKYGNASFAFHLSCTYSGKSGRQDLIDTDFTLTAGASKVFGVFPAGTRCMVKELQSAGASSTALDPENGTVVIAQQSEEGVPSNVDVTATNTYDVGSVTVIKKRTGAAAETRGKGPFEAQFVCTYLSDGEQAAVTLPNDGKVTLSEANGYTATVNDLLLGARCKIVETANGGADSTTMDPANGELSVSADTSKNVVTITNVFNAKDVTFIGNGGILSKTGADVASTIGLAVMCLTAGVGIILVMRRRQSSAISDGAAHQAQ